MSATSGSYRWSFYKSGHSGKLPPAADPEDLLDWMKEFCAAIADYDLDGRHPCIQTALLHYGIDGDWLEACLQATEKFSTKPLSSAGHPALCVALEAAI